MRTARSEGEKEEYQEEEAVEMRRGREACDCDVGARGDGVYPFTVYRRCVVMSFVSEILYFTHAFGRFMCTLDILLGIII
jgi:hypothetical protein